MAEEIRYNPSTDSTVFPDEGIRKKEIEAEKRMQSLEDFKRQVYEEREKAILKKETALNKRETKPLKIRLIKPKEKQVTYFLGKPLAKREKVSGRGIAGGFLGISKRPIADKLKVMRLSNMLEKKRLQNQIEKFKLQRKVELLKKKGQFQQVLMQPIPRAKLPLYPAYATPEIMGDIDSSFYGDFGHADGNLWGNEAYFDEDFYIEDWFGKEWDISPEEQLGLHIRKGTSPLLW